MAANFVQRLYEIVTRFGSSVAIQRDGDSRWTYDELWNTSSAIAQRLRQLAVPRQTVIAIELEKSPEFVASWVGTWKAGCIAMPVPPELPELRKSEYLHRSAAAIVINDAFIAELNTQSTNAKRCDQEGSGLTCAPDDIAYLFFTSGSTGTPKGVRVPHRGLVPMLDDQVRTFGLSHQTRSMFYLSSAFDASLSDVGTVLMSGGTLVIESDSSQLSVSELFERIEQRQVSYADLPPSVLHHAARLELPSPASLRTVVMGGEVCPAATVTYWAQRVALFNVYGPTEATVCTSIHACKQDNPDDEPRGSHSSRHLPIGRTIAGMNYKINVVKEGCDTLVDAFAVASESCQGELWISGDGLARDYLDDQQLTKQKFVMRAGERYYRTGDLVGRSRSGELYFLGRIDRQFKLLGRLVEPAEVESALANVPGLSAAAVFPDRHPGTQPKALVAFVETNDTTRFSEQQTKHLLHRKLPKWMVPNRIICHEKLPRTLSGKLDLSAIGKLIEAHDSPNVETQPISTRSDIAAFQQLRKIWEEVLGHPVADNDRFYQVGGDSLSAMTVLSIARDFDWQLSPDHLQNQTFRQCCERLEQPAGMTTSDLADYAAKIQRDISHSQFANSNQPICPTGEKPPRMLFLTGTTGFLGTWLLECLLNRCDLPIACLVRATSVQQAEDRIQQSRCRFLGSDAKPIDRHRVKLVCGDIAKPYFGLSSDTWNRMTLAATDVVHLAAEVHLLKSLRQLSRVNVDSVAWAVHLCNQGTPKQLHYASTLSVFVASDRTDARFYESDRLNQPATVFGGYGQSKFAAEKLIWNSIDRLDPSIVRYGLLTGDSRCGIASGTDQLSLFTKQLDDLGYFPASIGESRFDVTPVDQAAAIACQLILAEHTGAYHVCSESPVTLRRWADVLNNAGSSIKSVDDVEFHIRLQQHQDQCLTDRTSMAALSIQRRMMREQQKKGQQGIARGHQFDLFLASDSVFDLRRTRKVLSNIGIEIPMASSETLSKMAAQVLSQRGDSR